MNGNGEVAAAISHRVTVGRPGLDEGVVVWCRLVHDVLAAALSETE